MVQLCNYVTKQTQLFLLWIMNHEMLIAQFKLWEQSQLLLSWGFIKACIFKYSKYFDKLCRQTELFEYFLKLWRHEPLSHLSWLFVFALDDHSIWSLSNDAQVVIFIHFIRIITCYPTSNIFILIVGLRVEQ